MPKRARRTTGHVAKGLAVADPDAPLLGVDPADHLGQPHEALRPGPPTRPGSRADSQAGPADDDMTNKEATLPLPVDTVIRTKWLDGEYHLARVVSVRDRSGAVDPNDKEYYMHYVNMNRRMDTWVTAHVMDPLVARVRWHRREEVRALCSAVRWRQGATCLPPLFASPHKLRMYPSRQHDPLRAYAICVSLPTIVPTLRKGLRCLPSYRLCASSLLAGRSHRPCLPRVGRWDVLLRNASNSISVQMHRTQPIAQAPAPPSARVRAAACRSASSRTTTAASTATLTWRRSASTRSSPR